MKNKALWFPYTQMRDYVTPHHVNRGDGVYITIEEDKQVIDVISSWWAAIHGYNNKELNQTIIDQLNEISHFMIGGISHSPAEKLANRLVEITPDGLNHVFFSDSGSVGVEVALKMAVQYWHNQGESQKKKFISLTNSYHGDTFKAMEVGDDFDYHEAFSSYFGDTYYVSPPKGGFRADIEEVERAIVELENLIIEKANEIAAFIVEPIAQCAGGFIFYSPLYLKYALKLCRKYDILLIFDEVATGFGRTGKLFASEHCGITPDIMVLGKALTAGYIGHAATLATSQIFEGFFGEAYDKAFMHGPTFSGNPLACAVALKSIEIFLRDDYLKNIAMIEKTMKNELFKIKSEKIRQIRVLGAIGVIEVFTPDAYKGLQDYGIKHGIWIRPFGNYIYIMPPYIIKESELKKVIHVLHDWFLKEI